MTPEFCTAFHARLTDLFKDTRFYQAGTKTRIPPHIYEGMIAQRKEHYQEGHETPFIRWCIYQGEIDPANLASFNVMIDAGLWTANDFSAGYRDLLNLVRRLLKTAFFVIPPFKQIEPMSYTIGSSERGVEGIQPHPYYYARAVLKFGAVNATILD